MDAPAVVLAIVLAETAVGGLLLSWLGPTWGKVRHGYEILLSSTLAVFAWGAWAALRRPLASIVDTGATAQSSGDWTSRLLIVMRLLMRHNFEASEATFSKVSVTKLLTIAIPFLETRIFGWTCLRTLKM